MSERESLLSGVDSRDKRQAPLIFTRPYKAGGDGDVGGPPIGRSIVANRLPASDRFVR